MDPANVLLTALEAYVFDNDVSGSAELLGHYRRWRRRGGFEPQLSPARLRNSIGQIDFYKRLPPTADNIAGWLFAQLRSACETRGLSIDSLDPATLDRIEDLFQANESDGNHGSNHS